MALIDMLYTLISLADAALLMLWGGLDLKKYYRERSEPSSRGYFRDGCFLMTLGFFGCVPPFTHDVFSP
jgi:hypothetical protein